VIDLTLQVVNNQSYTLAADVFSFGIVLWELCTRKLPNRDMDAVKYGLCPDLPADCPAPYAEIVRICTRVQIDREIFAYM
jgi:serine/threonine protein kinase